MREKEIYNDQVEGRNAVIELLESGKDINKIFITRGERHGSIHKIISMAKENKVIIVEKEKKQMEEMAQTENYQGVIAIVPPYEYVEVEDILQEAKTRGEDPLVLILDGIEDPHNLGSIIRTAETAGVHGVIIPKRRAAMVNSTVNKVSAGAVQHMKIARVTNLSDTIEMLKKEGLWICGTDIDTSTYYYNQDLTGPIRNSNRKWSLNASVSTGIVIYEAVKQREK